MLLYPTDAEKQLVPLDSLTDAKERMLAKLEAGCRKEDAVCAGLNGSDDVAAV